MTDHDRSDTTHTADTDVSDVSEGRTPLLRRPTLGASAGVAALTTFSALAVAGVALADRGHGWGGRGDRGWWGVWSVLFLLAVVGATAALTALLVSRRTAGAFPGAGGSSIPPASPMPTASPMPPMPPSPPNPLASAETILAERLARGEISPDDYRSSVAALRAQPIDPTPPAEG